MKFCDHQFILQANFDLFSVKQLSPQRRFTKINVHVYNVVKTNSFVCFASKEIKGRKELNALLAYFLRPYMH